MGDFINNDPIVQAQVLDLVARERAKALSPREWRHRLAGYGYAIRSTEHGQVVEKLASRMAICALPAELCA